MPLVVPAAPKVECPHAESWMTRIARYIVRKSKGQIVAVSFRIDRNDGDFISYRFQRKSS